MTIRRGIIILGIIAILLIVLFLINLFLFNDNGQFNINGQNNVTEETASQEATSDTVAVNSTEISRTTEEQDVVILQINFIVTRAVEIVDISIVNNRPDAGERIATIVFLTDDEETGLQIVARTIGESVREFGIDLDAVTMILGSSTDTLNRRATIQMADIFDFVDNNLDVEDLLTQLEDNT